MPGLFAWISRGRVADGKFMSEFKCFFNSRALAVVLDATASIPKSPPVFTMLEDLTCMSAETTFSRSFEACDYLDLSCDFYDFYLCA